jgi:hypothetical protein
VARCAVLALALAAAWRGASGEPSTTEITISHVTVLLPPSVPASPAPGWEAVRTRHGSLPVRQLVRAFGGCFTWHTNSPQIVLIKEAAHLRCGTCGAFAPPFASCSVPTMRATSNSLVGRASPRRRLYRRVLGGRGGTRERPS